MKKLAWALLLVGFGCGSVVKDDGGGPDGGDGDGDADAGADAPPACVTSILFSGPDGLVVMGPDGSSPTPLGVDGFNAEWSPDGSRITYIGSGPNGTQAFIMNADGSNPLPVGGDTNIGSLHWSPDGTRLAYVHPLPGLGTLTGDLIVINTDGSGRLVLQQAGTDAAGAQFGPITTNNVTWSPDGQKIAYNFSDAKGNALHVANSNGSGDALVSGATVPARVPFWSPDGDTIAYETDDPNGGGGDIFAIAAGGGAAANLTANDDNQAKIIGWTPSNRILFRRTDDLFIMDRNGASQTNLTMSADLSETGAELSPDETALAITAVTVANREDPNIFVAGADGSNETPLTADNASRDARWQPCQ